MRRVVVVIGADPARSDRAVEGLRMSVGLALAGNEVRVVLSGAAQALVGDRRSDLPEARRAGEFLGALRDLGGEVGKGGLTMDETREADVVIRWGE